MASIKLARKKGLFEDAKACFNRNPTYKNNIDVTDEIWFFFDVEEVDHQHWDARFRIIQKLRRFRKKPGIRVRLLMTTGCIEYWFMLHYEMMAPNLTTKPEKERMEDLVKQKVREYKKGDWASISKIAEQYPKAVKNGKRTLENLRADSINPPV